MTFDIDIDVGQFIRANLLFVVISHGMCYAKLFCVDGGDTAMPKFHQRLIPNLLALLSLAIASPVFAIKPGVDIENLVDDQVTFQECDKLTITRTLNGEIRTTGYFDKNGNLIRINIQSHLHGSFTNTLNGTSLPFVVAQTDKININPDNSAIVATSGLIGAINVPGHGRVTADVGRIVFFFTSPDDPDPDLLFESGRHDNGPFPFICPFLE
jgi:hypothetical protein